MIEMLVETNVSVASVLLSGVILTVTMYVMPHTRWFKRQYQRDLEKLEKEIENNITKMI